MIEIGWVVILQSHPSRCKQLVGWANQTLAENLASILEADRDGKEGEGHHSTILLEIVLDC